MERVKKKNDLKTLRYVFAFLKPYKLGIGVGFIALIVTSAITLSVGQGLRLLIDKGFVEKATSKLEFYVMMFIMIAFILAVFTYIRHYIISWLGERVSADIRKAVFSHIIELHPGFFEENFSGEIQSRITTDTSVLQTLIGSSVSIALRNIIMMIGGLIWLFIVNTKLTFIILGVVPVLIVPIVFFGRKVRKLSKSSQDEIASVGTFVNERIRNIKTVQSFNRQNDDLETFKQQVETTYKVGMKKVKQRSSLMSVVIFLVLTAIAFMLLVGGQDVISGRLLAGELAAFVFYAFIISTSVGSFSGVIGDLQQAAGASERLMELLFSKNLIEEVGDARILKTNSAIAIKLKSISFTYPSRADIVVLNKISLELKAGLSYALVGHSGAGKSTLFELLQRFYDPNFGTIFMNNFNIKEFTKNSLRAHIAVVAQEPDLFTGTIKENIAYGKLDASEEEILKAAKDAYCLEFIDALPEKFDTFIGESGQRLSGGQKQRLAISRAILKNPQILLLDEATSALDANSEKKVQKALDKLKKNRTTITIAHRLATVIDADQIIVLHKGKVSGIGTHKELIKKNKIYSQLAKMQFST